MFIKILKKIVLLNLKHMKNVLEVVSGSDGGVLNMTRQSQPSSLLAFSDSVL